MVVYGGVHFPKQALPIRAGMSGDIKVKRIRMRGRPGTALYRVTWTYFSPRTNFSSLVALAGRWFYEKACGDAKL
jgi:hypothetical protein